MLGPQSRRKAVEVEAAKLTKAAVTEVQKEVEEAAILCRTSKVES